MTLEIIQIIPEFSTSGGAENVAWELAGAFSRAGTANRVLTTLVRGMPHSGTKIDYVARTLSRIPIRGALRYVGRAAVMPFFTLSASLALKRHPHAAVLSHGDSLRGDVLIVHAVNAESLAEKRRAGEWRWLLNPMHLWVGLRDRYMIGGGRYRIFVAVSQRVAEELQRHYRVPQERIRVIPNGANLARFRRHAEAGQAIRREFGIPDRAPLMLFVGHEFHRKGLAHIVGALARLPSAYLMVVGSDDPEPYRRLAGAAADRLIFAGTRRDMPAFYSAADVFVLASAYETFSLVCIEAMACGLPVVATPAGGIEDYLEDGVNGFKTTFESADIAETVQRILGDDELKARLRAGAAATAQRFDWDKIAARYIALLAEVVATRKAGVSGAQTAALPRDRAKTRTI